MAPPFPRDLSTVDEALNFQLTAGTTLFWIALGDVEAISGIFGTSARPIGWPCLFAR